MKNFLILTLLIVSQTSWAQNDSKSIYNALVVAETEIPYHYDQALYIKSVGGLVCAKIVHFVVDSSGVILEDPKTQKPLIRRLDFSCQLLHKESAKLIYNSLDVIEGTLPSSKDGILYSKKVGHLACEFKDYLSKSDFYACNLKKD